MGCSLDSFSHVRYIVSGRNKFRGMWQMLSWALSLRVAAISNKLSNNSTNGLPLIPVQSYVFLI